MEIRIVFMGTGVFAVPILDGLLGRGYSVVAVYTQPDKPAGRSQRIACSPVKRLAMEHGIPVVQPETFKSDKVVEELADLNPDLIVAAAFGRILPQEVLSLPKFGCLNIHPSLLPRHRGASPVADALLSGDEFTGVTVMLITAKVDSGPVLAQRKVNIAPEDTTGSLTPKLAQIGAQLLVDILPGWLEGRLKPEPQDENQATYSRLITKNDGEIDWRLSATEIWREVRAYEPWPGSYTWWRGKRLRIHQAIPFAEAESDDIGKVVALQEPPGVGVVTGRGILGLCQVQLEGKRQMSVSDFVRGQRDFVGSTLI